MFVQRWPTRAGLNPGAGDGRAIDGTGISCVTFIVRAPQNCQPPVDARMGNEQGINDGVDGANGLTR